MLITNENEEMFRGTKVCLSAIFNCCLYPFFGGNASLEFVDLHGCSHGDSAFAVLHTACNRFSGGEVEFVNTGFMGDAGDVVFVDATACQQYDAACRLLLQFLQQGDALFRGGLLPGSQDAVATQADDIFQRFLRIAANVEGTVEGDGHTLRGFHQLFHQRHVYFSFCGEAAEHDAVCSQPVGIVYIFQHNALFDGGVEEVAAAGADDDVQFRCFQYLSGNGDIAMRRGGTAFGNACTQFHPVGSAGLCGNATLYGVGTDFKLIVLHIPKYLVLGCKNKEKGEINSPFSLFILLTSPK